MQARGECFFIFLTDSPVGFQSPIGISGYSGTTSESWYYGGRILVQFGWYKAGGNNFVAVSTRTANESAVVADFLNKKFITNSPMTIGPGRNCTAVETEVRNCFLYREEESKDCFANCRP